MPTETKLQLIDEVQSEFQMNDVKSELHRDTKEFMKNVSDFSKMSDEEYQRLVDEELNAPLSRKLGKISPVINLGGITFGSYLAYKSFSESRKLGKFLSGQYIVFGTALALFNAHSLSNYMAGQK